MTKEAIVKRFLIVVMLLVLLFSVASQAAENQNSSASKNKIEMRAEKFKRDWKKLAIKLAAAFNLRLASGRGILLSENFFVRGSKNKMKIIWTRSQTREIVLEVSKKGTASLGCTIDF